MNKLLPILGSFLLASCPALGIGGGQADLGRVANTVELYRQDMLSLAPLASPELQADIALLDARVVQVVDALRAASLGGPVHDVTSAAEAALSLAKFIADQLPEGNDLRFVVAAAQIVMRHIVAAQYAKVEPPLAQ